MVAGTLTGKMRVLPVLSGSMTPAFDTGSAAIVTPQAASALRVGEVVVYHIPVMDHHLVMHRVVKVLHHHAGTIITTRGDANPVDDPWTARLKGGVVWVAHGDVPLAGYAIVALRSPFTIAGIVLMVAAWIAGMMACASGESATTTSGGSVRVRRLHLMSPRWRSSARPQEPAPRMVGGAHHHAEPAVHERDLHHPGEPGGRQLRLLHVAGARVQLSWTGAGGSGDGIDLLRATSSGGPYTDQGVQTSSIGTGSFISPYMTRNTHYWFELRTTVNGGTWFSAATSSVNVVTLNC